MRRLTEGTEARAELVLALCLWGFAAAIWLAADRLPPPIFDPLGSAAVPKLVAAVIALLAAAMLVQRLAGQADEGAVPDPGDPVAEAVPLRPGLAAGCFLAMAACPLVMSSGYLGFRETSAVFILLLGGLLSRLERRVMLILIPTALLLSFGFAWLFSGLLYIDLPVTPWLPF